MGAQLLDIDIYQSIGRYKIGVLSFQKKALNLPENKRPIELIFDYQQ